MTAPDRDFPGLEFKKLMSARNYAAAHLLLDQAAIRALVDAKSHARWRAHVYQFEGRATDAAEILTPHVEIDDIPAKFLRHQRACIYAYAGMYAEALADFRTLAADPTPRVVEALRIGCLFEIAHILAKQGSPDFQAACDLVPDDRVQFVIDSIMSKQDLVDLHQTNSA